MNTYVSIYTQSHIYIYIQQRYNNNFYIKTTHTYVQQHMLIYGVININNNHVIK
jgi:hypothetical protein